MTAIDIRSVRAEGCNLDLSPCGQNQYNAKLRTHGDCLRKQSHNIRRLCVGSNIEVFRLDTKQFVAHAPTREIGRKPVVTQCVYDRSGMLFFFNHTFMVARRTARINVFHYTSRV
jgi:hypothetical protein